jgi:hypothetical protein
MTTQPFTATRKGIITVPPRASNEATLAESTVRVA